MDLTRRQKIFLIINSLGGGGAERVMAALASELADVNEQWAITLVTLDRCEDKYPLSPRVNRVSFECEGKLLRSVNGLLRAAGNDQPDAIVSFLTRANCAAIICSLLLKIPCIISERVNTTSHFSTARFPALRKMTVRNLYPRADRIIACSNGVREDLIRDYGVPPYKVTTIYNPINIEAVRRDAEARPSIALPSDYIVSVGRLMPNKNYSLLLEAYALANINTDLVILGEGRERNKLAALADRLGVAKRVHMPGFVANPHSVVRRARFYVSSSNAEGFPNAMVEAMCVGQPVVVTDCDSGPSEILLGNMRQQKVSELTKGNSGILVPTNDKVALSAAFRVMNDPDTRARFSSAAMRNVSHFSLPRIVKLYQDEINAALALSRLASDPLEVMT
jgi:N-acetylgalactosamine-N,N'-diacetylbacillosaminyl-diphospho-undecaprenol 4-alpha-N-acetylgalactosaminyltransferase